MTVHVRRICILTGAHLCHNPRVIKEAAALSSSGFNVTILGAFSDETMKCRDLLLLEQANYRFIPVLDLTTSRLERSISRVVTKAGKLVHRLLRIENPWQLGGAYPHLKRAAFRSCADLYICHMEQALDVGVALHRAGRRVGIDMEDWYSEDLPIQSRHGRPLKLLRHLERYLLSRGELSLCTSQSMAGSLAATYHCKRPEVVYNTFPWADRNDLDHKRNDRFTENRPSLYWFSQTIGPGRGLEDLMCALPFITENIEIHLRGQPSQGYVEWLASRTPDNWRNRIFLHDIVHNTEILSRISEHDIGFAGEQPESRSRNVTVSNKLFHYLLGGVAVVASNTAGQLEIAAESDGTIRTYHASNPSSLAQQINALVISPKNLHKAKRAALRLAEEKYCWEIQKLKLLEAVEKSLQ